MKSTYFDPVDYDQKAVLKLKPADMRPEPELYQIKWWDYRLMHPVQATYFFIDAYINASRRYYRKLKDMDSAPFRKPFRGKDPFTDYEVAKGSRANPNMKPATMKALWRARQQADRMGIPYDFYCSEAVRFAEEHHWKSEPRAAQLYSKKAIATEAQQAHGIQPISIVDWIQKKWDEFNLSRITHSDLDYFKTSPGQTLTLDQRRHKASIVDQIKERENPAWSMAYAYENDLLLTEELELFFGENLTRKAISLADK